MYPENTNLLTINGAIKEGKSIDTGMGFTNPNDKIISICKRIRKKQAENKFLRNY